MSSIYINKLIPDSDANQNYLKVLSTIHKDLDDSIFNNAVVINYNNFDIGIVSVLEEESHFFVKLLQFPRVCRVSILSLIEASVAFLKSLDLKNKDVLFYSPTPCSIKFKLLFSDENISIENYTIKVNSKFIQDLTFEQITRKQIIVNL